MDDGIVSPGVPLLVEVHLAAVEDVVGGLPVSTVGALVSGALPPPLEVGPGRECVYCKLFLRFFKCPVSLPDRASQPGCQTKLWPFRSCDPPLRKTG